MITIAFVASIASAANGQKAPCVHSANQEEVAEIGECAAYYLVVANGLNNTPNQQQLAKDDLKAFEDMKHFALKIGADEKNIPRGN